MQEVKTELIWHDMDEEPLMCGVILYSKRINRIYDGSYIGGNMFEVNGLLVDKSNFDKWCQRGQFFSVTGLNNSLN